MAILEALRGFHQSRDHTLIQLRVLDQQKLDFGRWPPGHDCSEMLEVVAERATAYFESLSKQVAPYRYDYMQKMGPWDFICWFCQDSVEFQAYVEKFNAKISWAEEWLLLASVHRKDADFLEQDHDSSGIRARWHVSNIELVLEMLLQYQDLDLAKRVMKTIDPADMEHKAAALVHQILESGMYYILEALGACLPGNPKIVCAALNWAICCRSVFLLDTFVGIFCSCGHSMAASDIGSSQTLDLLTAAIEAQNAVLLQKFIHVSFPDGEVAKLMDHSESAWPFQSAIFPLIATDRLDMLSLLLEERIITTEMEPLTYKHWVKSICGYWVATTTIEDSRDEQHPPNGMPSWPLYMSIRLLCNPQIIDRLCKAGARLHQNQEAFLVNPDVLPILKHLLDLSSVERARADWGAMRDFAIHLVKASTGDFKCLLSRGLNTEDEQHTGHISVIANYGVSSKPFRALGGILSSQGLNWRRNGKCSECRRLWKESHARCTPRSEYPNRSKGSPVWPPVLQTQQSWEKWRTSVMGILKSYL